MWESDDAPNPRAPTSDERPQHGRTPDAQPGPVAVPSGVRAQKTPLAGGVCGGSVDGGGRQFTTCGLTVCIQRSNSATSSAVAGPATIGQSAAGTR